MWINLFNLLLNSLHSFFNCATTDATFLNGICICTTGVKLIRNGEIGNWGLTSIFTLLKSSVMLCGTARWYLLSGEWITCLSQLLDVFLWVASWFLYHHITKFVSTMECTILLTDLLCSVITDTSQHFSFIFWWFLMLCLLKCY